MERVIREVARLAEERVAEEQRRANERRLAELREQLHFAAAAYYEVITT